MGKSIGGAVVGILAYGIAAAILNIVFFFVLKREGILDPNTNQLTMVFMLLTLATSLGAGYLSGAVARAIGKGTTAIYIIAVVAILVNAFGFATRNTPVEPPKDIKITQMQQDSFDIQNATKQSPIWFPVGQALVGLAGLALGGLNKGDFGPKEAPTGQPGT